MGTELSKKEFILMKEYIEEKCGISISEEKAYLIESRLSKLLVDSGLSSFEEFYHMIVSQNDPRITEKIIDAITTNETFWFRDQTPWIIFENALLPEYIKLLSEGKKFKIRIWSAACSTGQEPYSIAMCIDKYLTKHGISQFKLADFEIIATDISATVLEIARMGKFNSISIMRGLDADYRNKYFESQDNLWILSKKITNAVHFQQFNLQNSFLLLEKFDLIFCRYVLIYFLEQLKTAVLNKMADTLEPNGVMFLGSSEVFVNSEERFITEVYQNGVYYRKR